MRVQTKLTVGAPDDQYEQEADRTADQVMRMPQPSPDQAPDIQSPSAKSKVQRLCVECEEELQRQAMEDHEELLQTASDAAGGVTGAQVSDPAASQIQALRGGGEPLPPQARAFFEPRFGRDFSRVRVHRDSQASALARNLQAHAFTIGKDMVFQSASYAPGTRQGKRLLAHELTHVIQQQGGKSSQGGSAAGGAPEVSRVRRKRIQRQTITMRSGRSVGVGASDNTREDVLHLLDSLHRLWSISNNDYDSIYPQIGGLSSGSQVPASLMPTVVAAISRNERPTIHRDVVRSFLNLRLSDNVGAGQANQASDVRLIQPLLHAHGLMSRPVFQLERAVISGMTGAVAENLISGTITAIARLKTGIASGTLGWAPIHADEGQDAGDRYGSRTFVFGMFSIFLSRGAPAAQNKVHVFFSPGGVQTEHGTNAVLHHGLRAGFESSEWILIGVPGAEPGYHTITTADIQDCLDQVGRGRNIDALQLSAHSRGHRGLRETVRGGLIDVSLVNRVVILDASYANTMAVLRRSGIPASRIVSYQVTVPTHRIRGDENIRLRAGCVRAIGYSRLIQDAMRTRPSLTIPPGVRSQLLTLPDRGCFTTSATPSGCQVNIDDFCTTYDSEVRAILRRENDPVDGLKTFVDAHDLTRLGRPYSESIYSHHFFVAEIAHQISG